MKEVRALSRLHISRFQGVAVITTHSIHNSLHSVGGIQMLLPLFAQIDLPHLDRNPPVDHDIWYVVRNDEE